MIPSNYRSNNFKRPVMMFRLILTGLVFGVINICCAEDFPPERNTVECTPRAGLPNFLSKAESTQEVKVAYLGGSITEQKGWRIKSFNYLRKLYPKAKFAEINAAIGGTGSDLGALRVEYDVLKFNPDLIFVEFAVNDAGVNPREIIKSMEGIIRKTWKILPNCDICFVYTLSDQPQILDALKAGVLYRSAATMELVADKYQIPSVYMGLEVIRLEKEGLLTMKAPGADQSIVSGNTSNQASKIAVGPDGKIPFSKDGLHPYLDTGHRLYEEAIERSFPLIKTVSKDPSPHELSEPPIDPNNYENSVMVPANKVTMDGSWMELPSTNVIAKPFLQRVDSIWKGSPGATLTFQFKGSRASIYHLLGPGCGKLEITIDGKSHYEKAIDAYCDYYRLSLLTACNYLNPEKTHTVTINVLPEQLDKENILFENLRPDFQKNPTKYEPLDWYVGAIFVVGEFVAP